MPFSTRVPRIAWVILALALLGHAVSAFATTRISLNGEWQFRTDPSAEGETLGWHRQLPNGTETVSVPHTWNIGGHEDYEGKAWYFRTFTASEVPVSQHLELHLGATFYKARIWLNGVLLGEHEGGYTAYSFDITPHLRDRNYLAVELDNRPLADTIPAWPQRMGERAWYDWWHYGGIVRDVWLTGNNSVLVRRQKIRSEVGQQQANVNDVIYVENLGKAALPVRVTVSARNDGGDTSNAVTQQQTITLRPGKNEVPVSLAISNPRLWSFDQPNLYRMDVSIADARGRVLDEQSDTFGLRTVEVRDRHLYLNGERVRLSGITRHEESVWEGLAETRGTMRYDYDDLKNLQVTLTRPVHYPQHPFIFDYADRNGILFVPEIPLWQLTEKQLSNPKVLALAKQQMREMVEQAGNHPSIFAWSVCNESETDKPGGIAYFRAMKEFLNELDPGRYVTFADNNLPGTGKPEDGAAFYADFIMMNQYYGTWKGPRWELSAALDKVGSDYPDKMVIISEFGVDSVFGPDDAAGDRLRTSIMREQLAEFAKRDWIGGAIFWCYQDYRSHRNLWPGQTKGYVPMGIVDENRQRRPSYYLWRELNEPASIDARLTGKDWLQAPNGFTAFIERKPETELPSYPLHNYRVVWEARDARQNLITSGEQEIPEIEPRQTIKASWQQPDSDVVTLRIRLLRPTGFVAVERSFEWRVAK